MIIILAYLGLARLAQHTAVKRPNQRRAHKPAGRLALEPWSSTDFAKRKKKLNARGLSRHFDPATDQPRQQPHIDGTFEMKC